MELITLLLGFVVGVMVGFFLPLFAVWYSQRTITIRK